jgi:hypothetical protein
MLPAEVCQYTLANKLAHGFHGGIANGVDRLGALPVKTHQAGLPQNRQMFRYGRLVDGQLAGKRGYVGWALLQSGENADAIFIGQSAKSFHDAGRQFNIFCIEYRHIFSTSYHDNMQ